MGVCVEMISTGELFSDVDMAAEKKKKKGFKSVGIV